MAAVTISPANPSDVSRLAEIQRLAFAPSRINQLIFGQVTPTDFDASASARLLKAIADPVQAVWKAEKEGEIVGFALWGTPHEHVEEPKVEETEQQRVEKLKKRFPVGANYELADSFFGSLDLGIKTPHYHLGVLVTDPSHQRTGAGTALLRWGCTQADKEGVDAYLEASDVGIPVYQKAGFKLIREPIRGGSDNSMVLYPMHRSPLRLTRATSAQLPTIATIHRTAFAPTLWFASLWGNCSAEAFDAWFIAKGRGWLEGKEEHFIVAMRGEDVLGYALWEEKQGPEEGEVERETSWPVGTNVAVADGFNKDMHKYTSTIVGRYWHLHFLATSPLFQRSGAGKALIQWGIDRATKNGLSVYLEGGSEALPLYQKLGFTICGAPVAGIDGSFADTPVVLHPVVVSPAQTEDLAALATLHRRAFKGSPHKVVMFPNVKDDDRLSSLERPPNEPVDQTRERGKALDCRRQTRRRSARFWSLCPRRAGGGQAGRGRDRPAFFP
ncbi:acyl-CoA N-acyltransferase [Leucosporidium creatinivorum]|uniref:Acyl-CoA N-acyltransferase n=1 Tax=Leucosporidium creatinivorum TaxID=106004 RepID=A0A1Y2F153_9BASI|nr:acyl-CoA N-acyltransferase [Leucosporidium creatinivorum]